MPGCLSPQGAGLININDQDFSSNTKPFVYIDSFPSDGQPPYFTKLESQIPVVIDPGQQLAIDMINYLQENLKIWKSQLKDTESFKHRFKKLEQCTETGRSRLRRKATALKLIPERWGANFWKHFSIPSGAATR